MLVSLLSSLAHEASYAYVYVYAHAYGFLQAE